MSEWQSIESAPRDGTRVLLCEIVQCPVKRYWVTEGWYSVEHKGWWEANIDPLDYVGRQCYPTHWMPLPEPPK